MSRAWAWGRSAHTVQWRAGCFREPILPAATGTPLPGPLRTCFHSLPSLLPLLLLSTHGSLEAHFLCGTGALTTSGCHPSLAHLPSVLSVPPSAAHSGLLQNWPLGLPPLSFQAGAGDPPCGAPAVSARAGVRRGVESPGWAHRVPTAEVCPAGVPALPLTCSPLCAGKPWRGP